VTPLVEEPIATGGWPVFRMTNKQQIRRALLLLAFLSLAFGGLCYRLVDLQVLRHDELSAAGEKNTQREFWQAPRRGDILDVNGNILATSVPVKTICADPSLMGNFQPLIAHAIAPLLNLNEADLTKRLTPYLTRNAKGEVVTNNLHYVRLAKNITEENWRQVAAAMTNLTFGVDVKKLPRAQKEFIRNLKNYSVFSEPDQMRVYPNGSLASQVIGFPASEEQKISGRIVTQIAGRDGAELAMNKQLSGVAGWKVTETDRAQHELVAMRDEDVHPRDGLNVVLTIDSVVQHIVETALADALKKHSPRSITGIVMRPKTGEILAMASLPNYDPNQPNTITPETRNRVITDVVEPGSTFKIVVVSGALNNGIVSLNTPVYCENGAFAFAGRVLHDHERLGNETVKSVITKSSNIGAAKIGIQLGADNLYSYAWNYGFGQRTGIPLPGEARGFLYPVKDWSKVSIAQIPMGHGVAVTRLQMLYAMASIANDGWLMRPMIVKQLQERDGSVVQRYAPERVRKIIGEQADLDMITALKTVPTKDGTAPDAAMKNYVVAGKTGTAQKAENGAYASGKYISSFIGFFPADDPQICISVVMDEPKEGYYGGKVCGPVFREIAERCASYLNIPPDPKLMTNNPSALVVENGAHKL
jgi:cell division protein FtsI/penicillin-binding protein 2